MSIRTATQALFVVVLVTGVTIGATTGAVAQETDDSGLFDGGDCQGWLGKASCVVDSVLAGASGAVDRAKYAASKALGGDSETTAAEEAKGLTSYYNANNETLEAYVNERNNFSGNETVEITLLVDGEMETRYLEVDVSDADVTKSEMVSSTNRSITETVTVCGYAATQATEELEHFTTTYAEPNKDLPTSYYARLKGRYNEDVETTLIESNGDCAEGS